MTISTSRRRALAGLGALTILPGARNAHAQAFPAKPIKLIVPHAAGGNSDAFGRILAQRLSDRIGQQVVVENRPGAGGTIASAFVARSAPDGYTLLVADNGTHAIAPTLYGSKLQYHVVKDFSPITLAAMFPTVLLVHAAVPARTAQEFVALAKAQPGKLTFSSAGTGNGSHLALELFRYAAGGLDMVHVPYKGGAPAIQALAAGEVQMTAVSVNTSLPHLKSGRVRALALQSSKRSPALPDLPTLAEGGINGAEADSWLAILGPAGIPADIVSKLNREIATTLALPDIKERLAQLGLEVVGSSVAQFQQLQERDVVKWGDAVKRSGAVVE
ncbi:MAG: tripartite tricarboxylate transporter substrate binding protein [Burkholderiaceae bacterium]|nr:tripartite tricarboxylate transporter substrate binding protein [Burkholderiaceae bacterium]MBP7660598.1 tripartite tricarboxylate transporter substrate binding protein [Burkholderiaceae bacterium]